MIRNISRISDLPPEVLEKYRSKGWTDEEILESLNDAIDLLNQYLWCDEIHEDISLDSIFSDLP